MTKKGAMRRVRTILRHDRENLLHRCEHVLASGAVDLASEPPDYILAKALVADAYRDGAAKWVMHERINVLRRNFAKF